jgi:hypothetical protein
MRRSGLSGCGLDGRSGKVYRIVLVNRTRRISMSARKLAYFLSKRE